MRKDGLTLTALQIVTCLCLLLLTVGSSVASDILNSFTESFSSKLYCDTVNTTAWWDTVAGELKLYPFELSLAGSYDTPGSARAVAIAGNYAYVADYASGLVVIDISDPTAPTLAGSYGMPGFSRAVAVAGNYAYVAAEGTGLRVIDISDPTTPTLAGLYNTYQNSVGIAVAGNYAYLAEMGAGLTVLDVSNPTNPTLAGSYNTPANAKAVAIAGDYAYVADDFGGLLVLDVSNPTNPTLAGSCSTTGSAKGIAVAGDYAYLADDGSGLTVLDVSNPTNPTLAGSYDPPGFVLGVAIAGDYAYLAHYGLGLLVVDIGNPTAPTFAGSYDTPDITFGVAVAGEYVYAADASSGLQVIHVADPMAPARMGNYNTIGTAYNCAVAGDYAYVGDYSSGLQVIDISNPTLPSFGGSYNTPGTAMSVAIDGDHAFVADYSAGLQMLDISNPTTPTWNGTCNTPGQAYSVAIAGDYAYVADGDSGLRVVDVSDPPEIWLAGGCATPGYAYAVAVDGDYAFVANGNSGLHVIDISSPVSPVILGNYNTPGEALAVAVDGDYVYVADGSSGLQILDVTDPASPWFLGSYDTPGTASGVTVAGDYAFIADGGSGLVVLDISDPTTPTLAGIVDTPGSAYGLAVDGDHVYLADGIAGLQVIQVFDRLFVSANNRGQSLVFAGAPNEISAVRFTPTQVDSIYWYASSDSGTSWTYVPADTFWHQIDIPGHALAWRAELFSRGYHVNPTCTSVQVEWKYSVAIIDTVLDVPEDEGGWARVRFESSGLDVASQGLSVVKHYYVHRRIDDIGFTDRLLENGERVEGPVPIEVGPGVGVTAAGESEPAPVSFPGAAAYLLDGRYYFVSQFPVTGSLPPGTWEVVAGVPALQENAYYSLTPTRADSMSTFEYTVYCVTAHTDVSTVYYVSPPDSGYSRDNLAPRPPVDLKGDYAYPPAQLFITWDRNGERDLSHYAVYKGDNPDFIPGPGNLIGVPWDTSLMDDEFDPNTDNYYKVSAWDIHENEGTFSLLTPDNISHVENPPPAPATTRLEQNAPNPFNPTTVIRFSVARPGWVTLRIYDMAGRRVRTLVESVKPAGWYEVIWDGRDDAGRAVPSGVYAYEIQAPLHRESRKMVVLR